jgi:hypothetical protein
MALDTVRATNSVHLACGVRAVAHGAKPGHERLDSEEGV